ncbi:uncharacterized protein LOC117534612 isoform X1 [Gymnodraco acuticeps]|uniref:Uncharacterized protein LOC117534612 isoform X1 n=1 Tax=Gymnodraco acuticeps TaxID=8218 RepID=A0A6P8SW13_GYMAC|nr:uncharacterized protein LOC117534612 isoform X1 [Gymnodraco acuticeps]XP_034054746.1 uncharacterized protein LOC117534612 isoform X1 [Gymnodraco acuticeps]XP_034054747.1 uncharacterized protein LOC117534612 isoform X1 [Gymnodraco acuticeps]
MFNRHPRLPEVMNACPMGDTFDIGDPEEDIDTVVSQMKELNKKVLNNIENAQARQQKSYGKRKRNVRICSINSGDEVLISKKPMKRSRKEGLASHHQGPFAVALVTSKGVATVVKGNGTKKQLNVSRLRPYYRLENCSMLVELTKLAFLHDHQYLKTNEGMQHSYACRGEKWRKDLGPLQDKLLKYVLDSSQPAGELIVRDGDVCVTREDFDFGFSSVHGCQYWKCLSEDNGGGCPETWLPTTNYWKPLWCPHADVRTLHLHWRSI